MSSNDIDKPLPNDIPNVTLTIRMIMSGKEVGSIIGKGGEIINSIREESGAKIHISDGSVPERIVTVTGSTDAILKSFTLIAKKFEEDGPDKNGKPETNVTQTFIIMLLVRFRGEQRQILISIHIFKVLIGSLFEACRSSLAMRLVDRQRWL